MDTQPHPAVDAFALAIMSSFGQLSLILAHMHRHQMEGKSDPDAPPPPLVLTELLKRVLGALPDEHSVDDIATAAQMLGRATEVIGDELFIVDVDRFADLG